LRLFNQGQEVALRVVAKNQPKFQPTDYIKFYAQGLDNRFTDTNVYWLYWRKKGFGKRIVYVDGSVTGQAESITGFYDRLHHEMNKFSEICNRNSETQDYWFWQDLNASNKNMGNVDVKLPNLPFAQTDVVIRVGLRGCSTIDTVNPDHHTLIYWNDTLMSNEYWDGDIEYVQEMLLASEQIVDKHNTVTIKLPGDTGHDVDSVFLNWIEVDYWRHFTAVDDQLVFTVDDSDRIQIEVKNLSQPDILVFDITDPNTVTEIVNFRVESDGQNYKAIFEDTLNDAKTYHVTILNQLKQSPNVKLWQSARLKSVKNRADYILITAKEFLPAVEPLSEWRRSQGLRVKSVSVEDIYNEFNHGIFDPGAIKAFLKYAYENWNPPVPRYVFLVGDASIDYRGYLNKAKTNKVPAHLYLAFSVKPLLIPDDNWYVDVQRNGWDDHFLPEMMIGRIPGDTGETVSHVIEKIIRFEKTPSQNLPKVLLIADTNEKEEQLNERLSDYLPGDVEPKKVYLSDYLPKSATEEEKQRQIAKARKAIIASINKGAMITNYAGHGAMDRWSKRKGLFRPMDVKDLKNADHLTFVLALTCNNGYFIDPVKYSLAEEFMLASGGAIGFFSSSGLTSTDDNEILSTAVFSAIFELGYNTLGEITTHAKKMARKNGIVNAVQSFILFGDPATTLKAW